MRLTPYHLLDGGKTDDRIKMGYVRGNTSGAYRNYSLLYCILFVFSRGTERGEKARRKKLAFLRKQADYIIDTSNLLVRNLRTEIEKIFVMNKEYRNLFVTIMSFGFKFGVPADCDLVFDVRFLPNPYYIPELKHKTGEDKEVQDFVLDSEVSKEFLEKLTDMVKFLIPNYIDEGKNQLVIGIGCTGGHHRSVTVAKELYKQLDSADAGYGIRIAHRDITR